jgi:hypothetical protein
MLSSMPRKHLQTAFTGDQDTLAFTRRTHVFKSQGIKCEGWLYLPKGGPVPPVVLMAHGENSSPLWYLQCYPIASINLLQRFIACQHGRYCLELLKQHLDQRLPTAPTTSSSCHTAPHSCCKPDVLAGMGAQKDMGLRFYAEAFASGGLAAFVFDYRSFGGSDGEPRHWVSPAQHVQVSPPKQAFLVSKEYGVTAVVSTDFLCGCMAFRTCVSAVHVRCCGPLSALY